MVRFCCDFEPPSRAVSKGEGEVKRNILSERDCGTEKGKDGEQGKSERGDN